MRPERGVFHWCKAFNSSFYRIEISVKRKIPETKLYILITNRRTNPLPCFFKRLSSHNMYTIMHFIQHQSMQKSKYNNWFNHWILNYVLVMSGQVKYALRSMRNIGRSQVHTIWTFFSQVCVEKLTWLACVTEHNCAYDTKWVNKPSIHSQSP